MKWNSINTIESSSSSNNSVDRTRKKKLKGLKSQNLCILGEVREQQSTSMLMFNVISNIQFIWIMTSRITQQLYMLKISRDTYKFSNGIYALLLESNWPLLSLSFSMFSFLYISTVSCLLCHYRELSVDSFPFLLWVCAVCIDFLLNLKHPGIELLNGI